MIESMHKILSLWDRIDPRRTKRPLVLASDPDLRIETGDIEGLLAADKVAIVAGYSPSIKQSKSTYTYLQELARAGFGVFYINVCDDPRPLEFDGELDSRIVIGRRENRGYDFGTWAVALARFPQLGNKPFVLLTNDSLAGPFTSIQPMLERACYEGRADVVAATMSSQVKPHLQSYFMMFRGGILAESALSLFFSRVRVEKSKEDVVLHNELELRDVLTQLGYSYDVLFHPGQLSLAQENPTLYRWRELFEAGWPFVKKTIISDPSTAPNGEAVAEVVKETFDTDINGWM